MIEYYINDEKHVCIDNDLMPRDLKIHRSGDLPAYIHYAQGGNQVLLIEAWCQHGKLHRINNPAIIHYHSNGRINTESYYRFGVQHNSIGTPAESIFNDDGKLRYRYYYYHGFDYANNGALCYDAKQFIKDTNIDNDNSNIFLLNVNHKNKLISLYCKEQLGLL